jgi:hypothetical protein
MKCRSEEGICPAGGSLGSQLRTSSIMESFGALPSEVVDGNSLKDMVGPSGLEPQTSTVSKGRDSLRSIT